MFVSFLLSFAAYNDVTELAQQFVDEVSNYIDAFITRREQLLELQRAFTLRNVAANAAYDMIQFEVLYTNARSERCESLIQ